MNTFKIRVKNEQYSRDIEENFGVNIFEEYPKIYFWLKHKGVKDGDEFIIYYWW